jgi:hypothetical protein
MKQLFVTALFTIALAIGASAQFFQLGAKAGANLTKIDGQSFNDGFKLSYQVGAYMTFRINKAIGLQPEVLVSQVQTTSTNFNGNLSPNTDYKLSYLSIPLLLNINAGKLLTFQIGPQYSILLNNEKTLVQNGKDAFKNGDFAMLGGLQLHFGGLKVYGRYNIGLSNINDIDNKENWKNQQIQVGVGLRIL